LVGDESQNLLQLKPTKKHGKQNVNQKEIHTKSVFYSTKKENLINKTFTER